ncbi:MAG: ATP-grasp domain-containing protein [Planctomycetes bacterium]|nr:ATP-grasp domain-containing protein [Planctomycetota bacterium]
MAMLVLFPNDSRQPRSPDSDYRAEWDACLALGFRTAVVDHDELLRGDAIRALRFLPGPDGDPGVLYRGWMMRVEVYGAFTAALRERGFEQVTSPDSYRICHHLPDSYPFIETMTAPSTWIEAALALPGGSPDWGAITSAAAQLGPGPAIIKDWVKSQKHAWSTACYIPNANDPDAVKQISARFLELQGEMLVGGLVFRRFVPLLQRGIHPRSGMPLGAEVRSFWVRGRAVVLSDYWAEAPVGTLPDLAEFSPIAAKIPSPFFTMDLAQAQDGHWFIMELGDGQVAGLPDGVRPESLFRSLLPETAS